MNNLLNILIGLALFGLLISRQFRTRPIRDESSLRLFAVIGIIGFIETVDALKMKTNFKAGAEAAAVAWIIGSLVLAAVLGVMRAKSMKVWKSKSDVMVGKGSAVTLALWIVAIAVHFAFEVGINHSSGSSSLGGATILLYLAVSLGVQREVLRLRASEFVKQSGEE
jgi:hypothetical protein